MVYNKNDGSWGFRKLNGSHFEKNYIKRRM
jgi:hypothetical protein